MKTLKAVLVVVAALALVTGAALAQGGGTGGDHKGTCPKANHPGARLSEALGLTPDQQTQVKAILQAAREQAKGLTDRPARRQVWRDAFEKIRTTVLTDEQRQKFDQMKQKFHEKMKERGKNQSPSAGPAA